jgi:hypothetical protein
MKLTFVIFTFLVSIAASAAPLSQVVDHYTQYLGDYGSSTAIMKNSPLHRGGDMRPKTVLKGVFYFGGSDVKRDLLSSGTQSFLCSSGFSATYSVYNKVDTRVSCSGNSMEYTRIGEATSGGNGGPRVKALLEKLYSIIKSGGAEGPVFLHCWYGVHASNTIAQIILKQFCGESDDLLSSNWRKVDLYRGLGEAGVQKNIAKVRAFEPYSHLSITAEERTAICYKTDDSL